MGFKTTPIEQPIRVFNVDSTQNKIGTITKKVQVMLDVQGRQMETELLVTGLGQNKVILGHKWLYEVNPDVD